MAKATPEDVIKNEEILPVAHEYNREDLNEMRDKLNAVIAVVNTLG